MKDNNDINEEIYETDEVDEIEDELNQRRANKEKPLYKVNNRNIIIGIAVAIILVFLAFFIYNRQDQKTDTTATASEIDQNSYNGSNIMRVDLNQVKSINFDLATADVRIQRSNTNPYIEYTELYRGEENVYTIDVSYEDGEVKLKSDIKGNELNMKNKIQIVRIFLPMEGGIDEIKGSITAGDVKITDTEVRNMDLNVKSGDITFENSFFGGSVSNEIGSIILKNTELANSKLTTNVGDILIEDAKLGKRLDFQTQNGDIIIKSDDSIENYNVTANLGIGNFILGNISYRNIKDGYKSENDANKNISMKTKVGDIIFNRGEGAILEEEEYITNESKSERDDGENALEKNTRGRDIIKPEDNSENNEENANDTSNSTGSGDDEENLDESQNAENTSEEDNTSDTNN